MPVIVWPLSIVCIGVVITWPSCIVCVLPLLFELPVNASAPIKATPKSTTAAMTTIKTCLFKSLSFRFGPAASYGRVLKDL